MPLSHLLTPPIPSGQGREYEEQSKKTHGLILRQFNKQRQGEERRVGRNPKWVMQKQSVPQADQCPICFERTILLLSFYCWAWCSTAWNMPMVSLDQLSWLHPLPDSCTPSTFLLGGQSGKKRKPWFCASTVQQPPKHGYVINTLLVTNPKHSMIQATKREKKNSVPPRPSTTIKNSLFMIKSCLWIVKTNVYS